MLDDFIQLQLERTHYMYNGEWYPNSDERSHPM